MKLYPLPNHGEECQGCLVLELLGALQRDAQAAINKVRSLLPEERRED